MSYINIPKTCELCGHSLVFFQQYGKSFCPVCEKEQLDRFSQWVSQQKSASATKSDKVLSEDQTALIKHLEATIQKDEAFLLNHQNELDVTDLEQKEIYQHTQGKIDMCRQVLGYLEKIRKSPNLIDEKV